MGTRWRVRLAPPPGLDIAAIDHAVRTRLDGIVQQMSHWESESLLSRFNRAPAGSWTVLPPDFACVIEAGLTIAKQSGGAFDPTLGPLVDLWGFGPIAATPSPSDAEIAIAHGRSGWRRTAFDAATNRLLQPGGLKLDLSGIAKGYAVDAIAGLLHDNRVTHCLVDIGGELAGRGVKPGGEPWWVELESPGPDALAPFRIALHEIAVATSGDYVRGPHNLDPTTGRPARHDIVSASVLHRSAMYADAWASALTVLSPHAALALARQNGFAVRIVTRDSDGYPSELLSPALAAMLTDRT